MLLVREVWEVAVCVQYGLLFHLVVGEDGLIIDEEGVSVGDCFILGDIVQLESHAVGAFVQHGMTIEKFWGNQVLDYLAIPHPLPKLIIIINNTSSVLSHCSAMTHRQTVRRKAPLSW